MSTTERKQNASRHILRRQGSSFGLRSSLADQEVLTLNALRAGVLVSESGVQLELLKEPLEAALIREQHMAALRDHTRKFTILWSVRLYNIEGSLESTEQWTLRSVSRGIRDALMSGCFIPGARMKVWIPAEVGGWWVKTKKRTRNEIVYEVEVVSVDWLEGHTWSIVKGFMNAVFIAMMSFIWTQISTRASNKKQIGIHSELTPRHPSPSKHKHHQPNVSSEVSALVKPTEVQLVVLAFIVDTVDFGEADVEVCDRGRCGKWFIKNFARFSNQEIINGTDTDVNGLLVHAAEADTKEEESSDQKLLAGNMDLENEQEHRFCEDQWVAHPKGENTYRLLLDPTARSLAISKQSSSTYNERRWVCIGRVVAGDDSINATLNCEDGGVLALIELRGTVMLT